MPSRLLHIERRFREGLEIGALELQERERVREAGGGDGDPNAALQVRGHGLPPVDPWLVLASAYLEVAALCYGPLAVGERRVDRHVE